MGYRIQYGDTPVFAKRQKMRLSRIIGLSLCFLVLLILLSWGFWPEGRTVLRDFLVPGDPDVTLHGLEVLTQELRDGENFSDAVTAFCREVIDGAALSP